MLLTGCEAPLNLSDVEKERENPVRRTDQVQALTLNSSLQVAVGNDGLILTRETSQSPWQRRILDGAPNLIDVDTCPDGSLIALSFEREIWHADAEAQQWTRHALPTPENMLAATCAPDGSFWAVGSFSTLMVSRDAGNSWSETSLNEDAMLSSIQFVDPQTALVTGEFGLVARTEDGGRNWQTLDYIPNDFYPQDAYFSSPGRGWVVGLDGMILHTSDGGASWQQEHTPVAAPLYGISHTGTGLFATGENGTLLTREGSVWRRLSVDTGPVWLRSLIELDDGELLVAGGNGTLTSVHTQ